MTQLKESIFKKDDNGNFTKEFLDLDILVYNLWHKGHFGTSYNQAIENAIKCKTTIELIESNKKLTKSNKKYQKAIIILTLFLVITGILGTVPTTNLYINPIVYFLGFIMAITYYNRNSLFSKKTHEKNS